MLLKIRTIGKKFEFDVNYACSISAFKKVYDEFGVEGIVYVAFMADCDNELYYYLDTSIRDIKARGATGITVAQSKSPLFASAIKEYSEIQSSNPYTKLKKTIDASIIKIAEFMDKKASIKKPEDADIDTLMKMIQKSPEILKSRDEMGKLGESEQAKVGRAKGGKELSRSEELMRANQQ